MNQPKVNEVDYIQFLIAAQKAFTCCEASRCQIDVIAHDSFVRLLSRQPADTKALWHEVEPLVDKAKGCLVIDDSTLDKPYARRIELVTRHWSCSQVCERAGVYSRVCTRSWFWMRWIWQSKVGSRKRAFCTIVTEEVSTRVWLFKSN